MQNPDLNPAESEPADVHQSASSPTAATEDVQSLVQELRARLVELETQNQELRRAQAKLAQSPDRHYMLDDQGERMIAFMNNNAILAWMKDEDGRYVFLSENFRKRFPFSIEAIRGKTDFEHALMDLKTLNDDLERQVDLRTSEAVQRATELKESQLHFRGVLDAMPDAIISIDSNGLMTSVNQATERVFGYVSSELIGKNIIVLVPSFPRERLLADEELSPAFAQEQHARRADGSVFPVDIKTNEIRHHKLFVAIIRDISARKALEKQVIDSAIEEQRRIGNDIHDGMGQELTGLRYMAQTHAESLASGQLTSAFSAETKVAYRMSEWLETIQGQMRRIIRQLVPVELDQQGLVSALAGLADRTTELHDVKCVFEGEQTLTVSDPGLATQLFRIVQEAVNNAVRHSQARLIKIVLEESGGTLDVRVIDDGTGIPSVSDLASRHSITGTGVGLNTMAYRAGLINARLQFEPGDQNGTVVSCLVPNNRDFSNH